MGWKVIRRIKRKGDDQMNLWGIFFCFAMWTIIIGLLAYEAGIEKEQERQKKRSTHVNGYYSKFI